jgi:aryl-alcohol dehydrogenase-like predicted oxidoreductase
MEYRQLGRTGINVSPMGLGSDNFGDATSEKEANKIINRALNAGINLLDSGDTYCEGESEKIIGRTLKENKLRHRVFIATKVDFARKRIGVSLDEYKSTYNMRPDMELDKIGPNEFGHSRSNIIRVCEQALKRLQTDYIDLFQLHRYSPNIPIDETLNALTDLVRQGKIRYVGFSTHPAWVVMEAIMFSELKNYVRIATEQPPYNLLDRRIENELIPIAQKYGVGLITWGPLAMGILAGRYENMTDFPQDSRAVMRGGFYAKRITERGIKVGKEFMKLAKNSGIPAAQLALLWAKDQPGITAPLIGARTVDRLESLLPVLEMTLSDEIREACDNLVPPGSFVADFHNSSLWSMAKVLE